VTPVIDVAGFLTEGEEARIKSRVESLERDTGFRLRVLAQNYPETPGLAIKDYWAVDPNTVVFVADPNTGNILNFNVGDNVDLAVPRVSVTQQYSSITTNESPQIILCKDQHRLLLGSRGHKRASCTLHAPATFLS